MWFLIGLFVLAYGAYVYDQMHTRTVYYVHKSVDKNGIETYSIEKGEESC